MARWHLPTRSLPAWITRALGPSTASCAIPVESAMRQPPMPRLSPRFRTSAGWKASSPPWRRLMRWRGSAGGREAFPRRALSWYASAAGATRTWLTSRLLWAYGCDRAARGPAHDCSHGSGGRADGGNGQGASGVPDLPAQQPDPSARGSECPGSLYSDLGGDRRAGAEHLRV